LRQARHLFKLQDQPQGKHCLINVATTRRKAAPYCGSQLELRKGYFAEQTGSEVFV